MSRSRALRVVAGVVLTSAMLAGGLWVWATPAAWAHARVLSTTPAAGEVLQRPPTTVEVAFDESVELVPGWIWVYSSDGTRVDTGSFRHPDGDASRVRTELEPALPDGSYAVLWRVVSDDGHAQSGRFSFAVGEPSRLPPLSSFEAGDDPLAPALSSAAHATMLGGLCVLLGTAWFASVVGRPRRWRLTGSLRTVASAGAAAALLGSVLLVPARWAEWAQVPLWQAFGPDSWVYAATSAWPSWPAVRIVSLAVALALLLPRRGAGPGVVPLVLAGLVAVLGEVLAGHAGSSPVPWVTVPLGALHVLAAAAWVGALPALLVQLRVTAQAAGRGQEAERHATVRRFGLSSAVLVAVVVGTGAAMAAVQGVVLGPWLRTQYEAALGLKVLGVLGVLALGATAFLVARRQGPSLRWFRAAAVGEAGAVVVVLVLTALLLRLAPARTALYETHERELVAGPVTITLQWSSLGDAVTAVQVGTVSRVGDAVDLSSLSLDAVALDGGTERVPVPLQEVATGLWVAPLVALPRPGRWAMEASFDSVTGERRTVTAQVRIN